jgi:hypothetical protein
MDASHKEWFGRLFDDFRRAVRDGDYVSDQTIDAIQCVATIGAAYESAARGSEEVAIEEHRGDAIGRRLAASSKVADGTLG